ncbi:MAG: N-acetyltransferase [Rhodospirillales bacterium]|nr:N-acetyltransferase [Rhodospirillales bacterium]
MSGRGGTDVNRTLDAMGDRAIADRSGQPPDHGLIIAPISEQEFLEFAKRFANSPEIGPIATCLDRDARKNPEARHHVVGLAGCGKLCAVACFELYESKSQDSVQVAKLDSVIVDPALRRRGLAGILIAQVFNDLVRSEALNVVRMYAHSVHPATVQMLRQLAFSDPPLVGAPISHLSLEGEARDEFLRASDEQLRRQLAQKRLECEFCRTGSRRSRPWCKVRIG